MMGLQVLSKRYGHSAVIIKLITSSCGYTAWLVPVEILTKWNAKVFYQGGRNRFVIPRNFKQKIKDYILERFAETVLKY